MFSSPWKIRLWDIKFAGSLIMTYSANYNNKNALQTLNLQGIDFMIGDPAGTRTQGPNIKSVVLYQLSYEINTTHLTP